MNRCVSAGGGARREEERMAEREGGEKAWGRGEGEGVMEGEGNWRCVVMDLMVGRFW